jgi:hypothetical protein
MRSLRGASDRAIADDGTLQRRERRHDGRRPAPRDESPSRATATPFVCSPRGYGIAKLAREFTQNNMRVSVATLGVQPALRELSALTSRRTRLVILADLEMLPPKHLRVALEALPTARYVANLHPERTAVMVRSGLPVVDARRSRGPRRHEQRATELAVGGESAWGHVGGAAARRRLAGRATPRPRRAPGAARGGLGRAGARRPDRRARRTPAWPGRSPETPSRSAGTRRPSTATQRT